MLKNKIFKMPSYTCRLCDATASKVSDFRDHFSTHTGEFAYECVYCPFKAAHSSAVTNHTICNHPREDVKVTVVGDIMFLAENDNLKGYACGNCGLIQISKMNVQKHVLLEQGLCRGACVIELELSKTASHNIPHNYEYQLLSKTRLRKDEHFSLHSTTETYRPSIDSASVNKVTSSSLEIAPTNSDSNDHSLTRDSSESNPSATINAPDSKLKISEAIPQMKVKAATTEIKKKLGEYPESDSFSKNDHFEDSEVIILSESVPAFDESERNILLSPVKIELKRCDLDSGTPSCTKISKKMFYKNAENSKRNLFNNTQNLRRSMRRYTRSSKENLSENIKHLKRNLSRNSEIPRKIFSKYTERPRRNTANYTKSYSGKSFENNGISKQKLSNNTQNPKKSLSEYTKNSRRNQPKYSAEVKSSTRADQEATGISEFPRGKSIGKSIQNAKEHLINDGNKSETLKSTHISQEHNTYFEIGKVLAFSCSLCNFQTNDEEKFMKHHRADHKGELAMWCKSCGKCFNSTTFLVSHIKNGPCVKEEMIFRCGVKGCKFETSKGQTFTSHLRHFHRDSPFIYCMYCQKIFTLPHCLVMHMQNDCPNNKRNDKSKPQSRLSGKETNLTMNKQPVCMNEANEKSALPGTTKIITRGSKRKISKLETGSLKYVYSDCSDDPDNPSVTTDATPATAKPFTNNVTENVRETGDQVSVLPKRRGRPKGSGKQKKNEAINNVDSVVGDNHTSSVQKEICATKSNVTNIIKEHMEVTGNQVAASELNVAHHKMENAKVSDGKSTDQASSFLSEGRSGGKDRKIKIINRVDSDESDSDDLAVPYWATRDKPIASEANGESNVAENENMISNNVSFSSHERQTMERIEGRNRRTNTGTINCVGPADSDDLATPYWSEISAASETVGRNTFAENTNVDDDDASSLHNKEKDRRETKEILEKKKTNDSDSEETDSSDHSSDPTWTPENLVTDEGILYQYMKTHKQTQNSEKRESKELCNPLHGLLKKSLAANEKPPSCNIIEGNIPAFKDKETDKIQFTEKAANTENVQLLQMKVIKNPFSTILQG